MAININLRLQDGVKERLEQIAAEFGALGAGGAAVGQPSISRLLMMVASGELAVSRREEMEIMATQKRVHTDELCGEQPASIGDIYGRHESALADGRVVTRWWRATEAAPLRSGWGGGSWNNVTSGGPRALYRVVHIDDDGTATLHCIKAPAA